MPNLFSTQPNAAGRITWKTIDVLPGPDPQFPGDGARSHYYAARATDAAPVRVNGQDEKFLFYRGVAGFRPPISTALEADGRLRIKNLSAHPMPALYVLSKSGATFGYRVHGEIAAGAEIVLAPPPAGGTLSALRQDLERVLVGQGLFEKEAKAMIETWRDDWFNDGTRVFYVVPTADVDAILPLQIEPRPASVVRAFIGRDGSDHAGQ